MDSKRVIVIAVPQTTLKLFEVEVVPGIAPVENLAQFKSGKIVGTYIGNCRVGEYLERATIFAEVPKDIG